VLASDIGGHRELIRNGVTGILFPPDDPEALADRVIEAIGAPATLPRLREAARRFVQSERTWTVSAAAYRSAYARARAGKGKTRSAQ